MVIVRIPGGNTGGYYNTNKMIGNVLRRHHYRVYSYTRRALSSKTNISPLRALQVHGKVHSPERISLGVQDIMLLFAMLCVADASRISFVFLTFVVFLQQE